MIIDIFGLPGAGKSTFSHRLKANLHLPGMEIVSTKELQSRVSHRTGLNRFVDGTPVRQFNYRMAQFRFENMELMQEIDLISVGNFKDYNLFMETAVNYQLALQPPKNKEIYIFDEGLLHRVVYQYRKFISENFDFSQGLESEEGCLSAFEELAAKIPAVDISIFLDILPAETIPRTINRVTEENPDLSDKRKHRIAKKVIGKLGSEQVQMFQYKCYERLLEAQDQKNGHVIRIDANQSVEACVREARQSISEFFLNIAGNSAR